MFVGILLRDLVCDFGMKFECLRYRDFQNQRARAQTKTIGSHRLKYTASPAWHAGLLGVLPYFLGTFGNLLDLGDFLNSQNLFAV